MRWLRIAFILLFAAAPVYAGEGFSLRWSYTANKDFTSLSAIDADYNGYADDLIAGSLDNNAYFFNSKGILLGWSEALSTVTSVSAFVHEGDGKLNDAIAGSLDDRVYVFWRPYGKQYLDNESIWWHYNTGDNVYSVAGVDLSGAVGWLQSYSKQKNGVVVGTGAFVGGESGKVLAFSFNGTSLWNYSASGTVTVLSSADLDSDGVLDNVLVGAGKTINVLNAAGTSIWSYSTADTVTALSPADFDGDEELDDLLAGAGNMVYALDPRNNKLLWQYDFGAKVVSLSAVDINMDRILDYFLVASGTKLYALQNSPSKGNILWSYDTGRSITSHVSIDFDGDGVLDDAALISGRSVYAYDQKFLVLPQLTVSKSATPGSLNVGEYATITLKVENIGEAKAGNVNLQDTIPEGLELGSGKTSLNEDIIGAGAVKEWSYTLRATKAGTYELPAASVQYKDDSGGEYKAVSNTIKVIIKESPAPALPPPPVEKKPPKLSVQRSISSTNLTVGENATVKIVLQNLGEVPALNISFNDALPPGLILVSGENFWRGGLEPNKSKVISYAIEPKTPQSALYTLSELLVTYRDASGKNYEVSSVPVLLTVTAEERRWKFIIIPILAAALAIALLRKRGLKLPEFIKADPQLEKRFIKVYKEYQARGERPTYGDMERELGVDVRVIDRVVLQVKLRLRFMDFKTALDSSEVLRQVRNRFKRLWAR